MTIKDWNRAYEVAYTVSLGRDSGFATVKIKLCNRHFENFRTSRTVKLTGATFEASECQHCIVENEMRNSLAGFRVVR